MAKLNDYGGQFRPDLKLSDFSADALAELVTLYSKLYVAMDGFWYLTVKERASNEEALACDFRTWERACKYEMAKITTQLNIHGNNVVALVKAIQMTPWFRKLQFELNVKDDNNAVLTVSYCATLSALEKEGEGRESEICNLFEPKMFENYASFFNPDIRVKCLKSPPRESQDEICCQWEFTSEE
jgi:hypothetical protein